MLADRGWPFDPSRRREDLGFFGPGSPTWKVWTSPTALLGFQRAVTLEHFDPFLTAAVADARGIYLDPRGRLDGTLSYFLIVAVGDSRSAIATSDLLMRVHAKATGIEPISGQRYSANSPESQLWIHVTGWHSVLKCYEMFGPGPLTPGEEDRYWAECVVAAELQTCKSSDVPRSREQVREYFESVRSRLCVSEPALEGMHYLLRTRGGRGRWPLWAMSRAMAPATVSTLPAWMRRLGDFDQPTAVDRIVAPLTRGAVRATATPRVELAVIKRLLPMTHAVLDQHFNGAPPTLAETVTPARARELAAAGA
ncbi:oxygenase MpaB family protein [Rhodococcus sp. NPDC127528]|uniref:oxygenase MpaB family protein n=1 Tax=unclassified Rhodococcus (in: high G+C Gram-positive bacteria) TaxID=192944 RepID=UPI003626802F